MIVRTPSSVAFCNVQSMRSPRETACTSVMRSGDSGSPAVLAPTRTLHAIARHREDLAPILAAAAVERDDRRAFAQPQHARDVIGRRLGQRQVRVRCQWLADVNARQSHVAISMPSRAVMTRRSISSGVITYGGMK